MTMDTKRGSKTGATLVRPVKKLMTPATPKGVAGTGERSTGTQQKFSTQEVPTASTVTSSPPKQMDLLGAPADAQHEVIVGPSGPTEAGSHTFMTAMGCMKEYQLETIRGIHKPANVTPDHFAIGSQLHAGKARWFARHFATDAATWTSIQDAMRNEMEEEKLPVSRRALQMGERYMREYIDYWGKRAKPTPIACEYKLGPTPLEPGDPFFMWRTARLDDVSKYPEALNKLCLGETKSTSDSFTGIINKYTMHPQILLQMLLWKMDPKGEARFGPIAGVMLDIIKKGYGEEKSAFARHFIPLPPYAMTWFPRTLKGYLRAQSAIDWDADAPRNPMRCTRQEGRALVACTYRELCLAGRNAANLYVMGKGQSLLSHKPEPGKTRMPWE